MWDADFGVIAKDILANITPTPWNKEIIESWREVAVEHNVYHLHESVGSF